MSGLPSLFISHGAPTFALEPGLAGAQLSALGKAFGQPSAQAGGAARKVGSGGAGLETLLLPRPQAVLVVSPHWITRQPEISNAVSPATVHDFGGFDPALFKLRYPAPGHPVLAARTADVLRAHGWQATLNPEQGLDHGAWVPLMHLFPAHDLPVYQVSMPYQMDAASAFAYGRALGEMGREGVLVIGSGSLTHNLYEFRMDAGRHSLQAGKAQAESSEHYAEVFSTWVREAVLAGDEQRVQSTLEQAPHAQRAHPTTEHFLPLLVALGAAPSALPVTVLQGGITHGMLAMESYVFGAEMALDLAPSIASQG